MESSASGLAGQVAVRAVQINYSLRAFGEGPGRITAGCYNIYPAEIERVLAGHGAVAMSAVGAITDEIKGELARAYVVLRPGAAVTEAELIEFCRPYLAAYKLPRSIRFVPDLPKTSTCKIMRRALRTLD